MLRGAVIANNNSRPARGMRGNNTRSDLRQKSHKNNNTGGEISLLEMLFERSVDGPAAWPKEDENVAVE
jgi:hypothetical protein